MRTVKKLTPDQLLFCAQFTERQIEDFRKRVIAAVRPLIDRDYGGSRVLTAIACVDAVSPAYVGLAATVKADIKSGKVIPARKKAAKKT